MTTTHITEICPELDTLPAWAREAFHDGRFFRVALERVEAAEQENNNQIKAILNAANVLDAQSVGITKLEATIKDLRYLVSELIGTDDWVLADELQELPKEQIP